MAKVVVIPPKERRKKRGFFYWFWSAVISATVIFGLVMGIEWMYSKTKSQQEINFEKNFLTGILIPPPLLYSSDDIHFQYGSKNWASIVYPIKSLLNGIEFTPNILNCEQGVGLPTTMKFKIQDGRLYVSDSIVYLKDQEVIGWIDYNHWALYDNNKLDYYEDDTSLEVIDKQGHVALSLHFKQPNRVIIQGYFIGNRYASVAGDGFTTCFDKRDPNWKEKMLADINKISRIHPRKLTMLH